MDKIVREIKKKKKFENWNKIKMYGPKLKIISEENTHIFYKSVHEIIFFVDKGSAFYKVYRWPQVFLMVNEVSFM